MLEKGENKDISVIKGLLSFRGLGYKVQVAGRCCRGKVSKCILKNISYVLLFDYSMKFSGTRFH
jgi:hypothetical protein